jgi:hypothetical protein
MDWQHKAAALAGLCEFSIKFREAQWRIGGPEPWYISQGIEVANGRFLTGTYGNGYTPQEAIENHWKVLVDELPAGEWLVIRAMSEDRRAVRWNGFMWADHPEPKRDAA